MASKDATQLLTLPRFIKGAKSHFVFRLNFSILF